MTTPSKIWMRSLSPSLILVCTLTVSPTRNSGTCPRTSGFTFRCSTSSIAFERIFDPSCSQLPKVVYRSPKNPFPSSLLLSVAQQIRPPLPCPLQGLFLAPLRDLRVIAREQDFRHFQAAKIRRAGVLRPFEQALAGEALMMWGKLVPQHTRQQTRHG